MVCTRHISYLNKKQAFVHSRLGFINTGGSMENKTGIRAENTNSSSKNLLTHHVPGQWLILYSSFFAEWSLKKKKFKKKNLKKVQKNCFFFSTGCFFERRKKNLVLTLRGQTKVYSFPESLYKYIFSFCCIKKRFA